MLLLTFTIIAIAILGSWFFYSFILDHLPGGPAAGDDEEMTMWDWGDLDARAFCTSSRLGEINHLVTDFNEMAEKLQTLDIQRKSWNAAIAHELRTPVTILRGRLQGLVDGVFIPDPVLFNNLLKQTEGLTRLIEDLRVISSDGGAGYTLYPSQTDLKGTIQNALDTFMPEFSRKAFTVNTELRDQQCVFDPLRINQTGDRASPESFMISCFSPFSAIMAPDM
ncbi:hypothetical protein L1887_45532 [Cichorium endivia]|nr:hypothetical protein L1887_45532 [Cichorium endivia]